MTNELLHSELTQSVIGAFYEVYNTFKPGLLESLYLAALERELRLRGHQVARECAIRVMYKGEPIGWQRLDMVVDDLVIVEAKATQVLHESAERQLNTYLRATRLEVGLLLHFGPTPQFFRQVYENRFKPRAG